jgi:hypothetical protein
MIDAVDYLDRYWGHNIFSYHFPWLAQKEIRAGEEKEAFPTRMYPSNTGRWTLIFGFPEQTVSFSVRSGANVHEEALFLWKCCCSYLLLVNPIKLVGAA